MGGSAEAAGSSLLVRAGRLLATVEGVFIRAAEVALAVTAVVIVMDVIARYAFNSPLAWADELVERYLLVIAIYFALAHGEVTGAHVRITILTRLFAPELRRWIRVVTLVLSAIFFVGMTIFSGNQALGSWQMMETDTGLIPWPLYLAYTIVPLGTTLMTFRLLHEALVARPETTDELLHQMEETEL